MFQEIVTEVSECYTISLCQILGPDVDLLATILSSVLLTVDEIHTSANVFPTTDDKAPNLQNCKPTL